MPPKSIYKPADVVQMIKDAVGAREEAPRTAQARVVAARAMWAELPPAQRARVMENKMAAAFFIGVYETQGNGGILDLNRVSQTPRSDKDYGKRRKR